MKNIKNWKSFLNERLRHGTYMKAAKRLKELGHTDTAKKLQDHAHEHEHKLLVEKYQKEFSYLGEFGFSLKTDHNEYKFKGDFLGLQLAMSYDMYIEECFEDDNAPISIPTWFNLTDKDDNDKVYALDPFWIYYTDMDIKFIGPMNFEESPWYGFEGVEEGGNNPFMFDNRLSANKFLKYLKSDDVKKQIEKLRPKEGSKHGNIKYEQLTEIYEKYVEIYNECVNNINIRQLYR